MTLHKTKRKGANESSAESRYLSILGAVSVKEQEEQVVSTILATLADQIEQGRLPIRLSKIASNFLIQPHPQRIRGSHDGQLEYDKHQNRFLIKLCNLDASNERARVKRNRFTYAHEMAHRFFFVEHPEQRWMRAIDLITNNLPATQEIVDRFRLNELEEGLCNRIAHRILIPDALLFDKCKLGKWFDAGDSLYSDLSTTADDFNVSRECLIVAISSAIRRKIIEAKNNSFLMVIGKTRGPMTRRGKEALRVNVSFFPRKLGDRAVEPLVSGYEVRRFGSEAEGFFEQAMKYPVDSKGEISISISLNAKKSDQAFPPTKLIGCWKSFGDVTPQHRRLCIWGTLVI